MEVEDLKLEVLVRLTDSELEVGPSMENMALVMSGQGSGVAGPAVLLEKDKLEMLSQREGRGPDRAKPTIIKTQSPVTIWGICQNSGMMKLIRKLLKRSGVIPWL